MASPFDPDPAAPALPPRGGAVAFDARDEADGATVVPGPEEGRGDVLLPVVADGGRGLGRRDVREHLARLGGRMDPRSVPAAGARVTRFIPFVPGNIRAAVEPTAPPARS